MSINVGDALPAGDLQESTPKTRHNPAELFGSGKHILFGVPGAFTPGCSKTHLPGYVNDHAVITGKGMDSINCIAVNDAFVMGAWNKDSGSDEITMLADGNADFVEAIGLTMDGSGFGMGKRGQRFSMVVEDGTVTQLNFEDPGDFKVSSAEHMLGQL